MKSYYLGVPKLLIEEVVVELEILLRVPKNNGVWCVAVKIKKNCDIWDSKTEPRHSNGHPLPLRQRHSFCQECPTLNIYPLNVEFDIYIQRNFPTNECPIGHPRVAVATSLRGRK